ncbi:MAG: hypothetical protein FJ405_00980 [Verrucomicrobia bacterium]|nr:hypothetical protein [Verrucomicrobiota bacterium]
MKCFTSLIASLGLLASSTPASAQLDGVVRRAFGPIQPAISPDGQSIALSLHGAIFRMPSSGGTLVRLTRGEGWDVEPAWSPDGTRLALINSPGLFAGPLRIITTADGVEVPLPKPVLASGRLQFSPDGQSLIGMLAESGQPERLQRFDLKTGALSSVNIAPLDPIHRRPMKWALSPDGGTILFTTYADRPGEQTGNNGPSTELWRVPTTGGAPKQIVRWPSRIYGLAWDARGSGVFVVTDRGVSYNDIWHIPLDTPLESARKWTFGQADEDWPSVSGDGRWLLHTDNSERATALTRVNLESGHRESIAIDRVDLRAPAGRLRIEVKDANTGEPLTARVSVQQHGGKFWFPLGSLYRLTYGVGHFYLRRRTEIEVPAGRYTIQVWHGQEYSAHRQEIDVPADQTREVVCALERWIDMPARGWFSGENHIHANYGYGAWHSDPSTLRDQCEGEDLHVSNIVVANSDGEGVFDREYFLGRPDPLSTARHILYWNQEFRSTIWGHLTLGNLSQIVEPIFTGFQETTNPWDIPTNADIGERTHRQGGTVSYTHPASNLESPYDTAYAAKGLPVDAALGRVDTLDVMGGGYAASLRVWYLLLNCGFRIPAAAGTDVFVNRISSGLPGWGRAYVKLPGGLNYGDWMRGQKAGRSFVTSGPMLEMTIEGRDPGATLKFDAPGSVRVQARAQSPNPIEVIEIVVNGEITRALKPSERSRAFAANELVPIQRSGWIAARCSVGNGVAHVNPVYIEVAGKPIQARDDAEILLKWIDRLEADVKKRDRIPTGLDHVQMQIDVARDVYRKLSR